MTPTDMDAILAAMIERREAGNDPAVKGILWQALRHFTAYQATHSGNADTIAVANKLLHGFEIAEGKV